MATAHLRAVLEGFDQARRELADTGKAVDDLSNKKITVGDSANESAAGIKALGESSELSSKQLAMVGAAAAAVAAAVLVGTKVLYDQVDATAELAAKYNDLRQTTGLTVETISGLSLAFEMNGVSVDQGAKAIEKFNKSTYEAQNGNKKTAETFQALGIDIDDFRGDTEGALLAVAERFSQMEDGAGKTALAMALFGRSGAQLIPFLNEGAAGLERLKKEAEAAGIVMSTETAKAADELKDAQAVLNANVRGFWQELTTPMVVALGSIAGAMRNAKNEGEGLFGVMQAGLVTMARFTLFGSEQSQLNSVQQRLKEVRESVSRHMASGDVGALRQAQAEEASLVGDVRRLTAFTDPTLNNTKTKTEAPDLPDLPDSSGDKAAAKAEKAAQKELEAWADKELKKFILQEKTLQDIEDAATKAHKKQIDDEAARDLKRFAAQERAMQQVEDAATKAFERRQKESAKTAEREIRDVNRVTYAYREDKIKALEQLEQKYKDAGMEGSEGLKKVSEALREARGENDRLIASATTLKSSMGQLGFDSLAIIQGTMRGAQKEISEVLKGHISLGEAARNIWKSIGNAAIDELSRVVVNEGWKAILSFFKGEGVNLSWISSAFNSITSNFSGVIDALSGGFNSLLNVGSSVLDSVMGFFGGGGGGGFLPSSGDGDWGSLGSIASLGYNIFTGNWLGAGASLLGGGGFVGDILGGVGDFVGDIFGGFFATGTDQMVTKPTMVIVGENGPERLQVTPMAGGSTGVGGRSATMNFYGPTLMGNYEMSRLRRELGKAIG